MIDLFHISLNHALPSTLVPRAPDGNHTKDKSDHALAEPDDPRVSFSPTLAQCLQGVYPNVYKRFTPPKDPLPGNYKGYTPVGRFAVYQAVLKPTDRLVNPSLLTSRRCVWDAHVTDEYWVTTPVEIRLVGYIDVTFDATDPGFEVYPFDDHEMETKRVYPAKPLISKLIPVNQTLLW